ncbi:MAG: RelA/SpoT family protein [Elusimicrobia bacterium]|nr:RelA/SpoT family protein [Elusimicrobiota bacterium]
MIEVLKKALSYMPPAEMAQLEKAYEYANCGHFCQTRASGEPYLNHCVSVALNLAELKLDSATIAAALLHDILEDTLVTEFELRKEFGDEVVNLVQGVTKINSYQFKNVDNITKQAENWRKMLLAVIKDIRVILIKLADRLHNMRTIKYLAPDKQKEIANESMSLYAPFAHRLGINKWKSELEDLSFEVLMPLQYNAIKEQWDRRAASSLSKLSAIEAQISQEFKALNIPFKISARPKNLYGIYKKMERQRKPFSAIEDLFGVRIITDTVEHCYALLGIINADSKLVEGSFTDYISAPKNNMYQSLHLTTISEDGVIVEIQIRTEEMDRRAEYGIAAHWRYKQGGSSIEEQSVEKQLDWLKQILRWQQEMTDSKEFMSALRTECKFEQIYVFTPKNMVIKLPEGASTIDFAYAVHSDVGNTCMGAKVNGKMVQLNHVLKTGDICEILTRKNAKPNANWLEFAITASARHRIRKYLRERGVVIK